MVDILFPVLGTDWKKNNAFVFIILDVTAYGLSFFGDVEDKFISGMVIRLNMSPPVLFSFPFIFLVKNF